MTHHAHTPPLYFERWRDVPADLWRWRNFSPAEIACRGTGKILVHPDALDRLQRLRDRLAKPLVLRSAYRSPEHNARVGGARRSRHMEGHAFDVAMANHDPHAFEEAARAVGFTGFGFYPASDFMHIDLGPARTWGTRFPLRLTGYVPERRPPEAITTSRTVGGAATAAAGGGAVLAEAAGAAADEAERAGAWISSGTLVGLLVGGAILVGAGLALYARWDDAGRPGLGAILRGVRD